jgi:hypothetical protein
MPAECREIVVLWPWAEETYSGMLEIVNITSSKPAVLIQDRGGDKGIDGRQFFPSPSN